MYVNPARSIAIRLMAAQRHAMVHIPQGWGAQYIV
jgi:hypothetical protein